MLLEEEKSRNVVAMDKAWEIWLKENAIIFHCINVAPMELQWRRMRRLV
jgi:hypothetical protein